MRNKNEYSYLVPYCLFVYLRALFLQKYSSEFANTPSQEKEQFERKLKNKK